MRISVIGTGYLGAVHAVCMAELGHEVIGFDTDAAKIGCLSQGESPFYEPELDEHLQAALATGRLRFTTAPDELAQGIDVHFLCVGTPQRAGSYAADLTYVDAAVDMLIPLLDGECLIVGKSTVPVGTAARLQEKLAKSTSVDSGRVHLAWNPEFLREGFAVQDTLRPDRLVFGIDSDYAHATLMALYAPILAAGTPCVVTDFATAELVKVAANAFLATKISFINAMADVCDAAGADVTTLAKAIGYDERIGSRFLAAGLGFGGGCLPKDIRAFKARAGELGAGEALTFLREVDEINMGRRDRAVDTIRSVLGGTFLNQNVAVLGAAFKPDSDDVRDSPALSVAAMTQLKGAQVRVHDPKAIANARRMFPTLPYFDDVAEACADADVVLLATEWRQYRDLDPTWLGGIVRVRRIIDGRNVLDARAWRAAGWDYRGMGTPR